MAERARHKRNEVTYIVVAGQKLPASVAICPECRILDLSTIFNTSLAIWEMTCSKGHKWKLVYGNEVH